MKDRDWQYDPEWGKHTLLALLLGAVIILAVANGYKAGRIDATAGSTPCPPCAAIPTSGTPSAIVMATPEPTGFEADPTFWQMLTPAGQAVLAGLFCPGNAFLIYDGPQDIGELWEDENHRLTVGVRVQRNKVMRTRPIFREWAADVEIMYDPGQLNEEEILEIFRVTGETVGLCDWRPKFGRFAIS